VIGRAVDGEAQVAVALMTPSLDRTKTGAEIARVQFVAIKP